MRDTRVCKRIEYLYVYTILSIARLNQIGVLPISMDKVGTGIRHWSKCNVAMKTVPVKYRKIRLYQVLLKVSVQRML